MNYESQRVQEDLPFEVRQNGQTLKLRVMSYDKALRVPGYPETTRAFFFVVDNATPLDPTSAFELDLKWGRRFGSYPNQVVNASLPLDYSFHGWRAAWYGLVDADVSQWDWVNAWQTRGLEIAVLLLGLVVLTTGLVMQKRLSAGARRLKWLRGAYLVFTLLVFTGWAEAEMIENANWTNTASIEPFHHRTSERVFDYSWAMDLIDRSMLRLSEEWSISGRSHRFEVLEKYLSGSREIRGR
jgi:hypothetical protein